MRLWYGDLFLLFFYSYMIYMLVGGLEHVFPYIGNNTPNWLTFFRGIGQPPTSMVNVPDLFSQLDWFLKLGWPEFIDYLPVFWQNAMENLHFFWFSHCNSKGVSIANRLIAGKQVQLYFLAITQKDFETCF